MRKAFTLVELLVVIAIIVVLVAILFPVFAQAKTSAKKTSLISNIRQIGTAMMVYTSDSDDLYPRNDDCAAGSSLNPSLNSKPFLPAGPGCAVPPFYYRMNHYAWQKWLVPYAKSVELFKHTSRPPIDMATSSCPGGVWSGCGQIGGSIALNLALTGALNTFGDPNRAGAFRNSWLGGSQTSVPDVSAAMLYMELFNPDVTFVPVLTTPFGVVQTAYPVAIRELWTPNFMRGDDVACTYTDDIDRSKYPFSDQITIGLADGSAKTMPIRQFLARTPSASDYQVSSRWPCTFDGGSWTVRNPPVVKGDWPMWAIQEK